MIGWQGSSLRFGNDVGGFLRNAYLALKKEVTSPFLPEWTVAMFAYRESPEILAQSIRALLKAVGRSTAIDVIVNGNEFLAVEAARFVDSLKLDGHGCLVSLRIWHVAQGDKAHAWNQYLYGIWEGAEMAFFVDGYVRVHPDALRKMSDAMSRDNHALAATGVPSQGSSALNMKTRILAEHGLHGNLHVIRGMTLEELRKRKFILPLGIYRTDSLIGAAMKFNLDPVRYGWDSQRIHVVADASWDHTPLSIAKPSDWAAHFKRMMRQGQGVFENLAIRRHLGIESQPLGALPETACELANVWMKNHPQECLAALLKQPLAVFSLNRIRRSRDWSDAAIPPRLLIQNIKHAPKDAVVHQS